MKLFGHRHFQREQSLPILQTERLVLRAFDPSDAVDVYSYAQNPKVGMMAGWSPHQSIEETRALIQAFIERGDTWAVVEKKSGCVIGTVTLRADVRRRVDNAREIGYALGESYWGQGYAPEACREVMRYAFDELHCPILSAAHFPANLSSRRVIKKLGFSYEGTLRVTFTMPDGALMDQAVYSMTESEYRAMTIK